MKTLNNDERISNSVIQVNSTKTDSSATDTWSESVFTTVSTTPKIPKKWIFVFFDLPSEEFTKRVALHRQFRKVGLAMHSQSVYFMPYTLRNFRSVSRIDDRMMVITSEMDFNLSIGPNLVDKGKAEHLTEVYQGFIESLFLEIENKIDELGDAKADPTNTRGYTKRYKKMWDRIDNLREVVKLVPSDGYTQRIALLEVMVEEINAREPGMGVSH